MNTEDVQPLVVGAKDAAKMMGISTATFWRRKKTGDLPPHYHNGKLLKFPVEQLKAWINQKAA